MGWFLYFIVVAGIAVGFMVRKARQRPRDPEENLKLLLGPRGMALRDRNRAASEAKWQAERPSQAPSQQSLRPELKPYLTQLCKVHATKGGFSSSETNRIGQEIHDKHGHESMVAVCDELRSVLGAGPARDLEHQWGGIGEWQG